MAGVAPLAVGREGMATDCTVATVSGEPPPRTYVREPSDTAAASCTAVAKDEPAVMVPVPGTIVETVATELPAGVMPPRTVSPAPVATTDSRESGAPSCQGSTPASIEGVRERTVELDVARFVTPALDVDEVGLVVDVTDVEEVVVEDGPLFSEATATPTTASTTTTPTAANRRRRTRSRRCSRERRGR
jgi:hypothetical protein